MRTIKKRSNVKTDVSEIGLDEDKFVFKVRKTKPKKISKQEQFQLWSGDTKYISIICNNCDIYYIKL